MVETRAAAHLRVIGNWSRFIHSEASSQSLQWFPLYHFGREGNIVRLGLTIGLGERAVRLFKAFVTFCGAWRAAEVGLVPRNGVILRGWSPSLTG